ncbi:DUF4157 domain-containing protein [Streptomyces sp. NPDC058740]|uniref:eCIS core domain-containing protein n=1 Tax=Streptomyces sp. NPDC058740 TaxID=3346619 RepID=UPI0036AA51CB
MPIPARPRRKDADAASRDRADRPRRERPDASAPPPGTLSALQRAVGNAAVARMLGQARDAGDGDGRAADRRAAAREVLRSAGQPLDGALRTEMEQRLGADFADVRVHTDPVAQRSATELGARAYTSGNHVVLTDGGRDKHTLAHELTHVIQQRQGPVDGTDSGDGLRVSEPGDRFERAAEANARRVMSAPVQRSAGVPDTAPSAVPAGRAVVQRKGPEELGPSLPADPPRAGGLLGRFAALTRTQPEPTAGLVTRVRESIAAYDADPNRDPMHCLMALTRLQFEIAPAEEDATAAVKPFLSAARKAVEDELDLVRRQIARDDSLPEEARQPFRAMTDGGLLWQREDWADSAAAFHMKGAGYFRELSELNRAGMGKEIAGQGDRSWVAEVRTRLTSALRQSVLCHYTSRERAEQMLAAGHMKSKTELLRADPGAPNNSEAYDKHVLANEGFVFFFLEVPGSPFRETRFGGSEPVRIEIPLLSSPLMTQGWLMLSDFAQREYPTLRARPDDPAQAQSRLGTREESFSPEFTVPVRKFDVGAGDAADSMDHAKMTEEMMAEADPERRGQIPFAMTQALADPHSAMTYGSGAGARVHPERLRSNTLMGADIVPGLAERAIVEIQRLDAVNPQLAAGLKAMSGERLMQYLLKDLLRPQAMLPGTVSLGAARVVLASGQQVTVPVS